VENFGPLENTDKVCFSDAQFLDISGLGPNNKNTLGNSISEFFSDF
jgi:hypothetical protein